MRMAKTIKTAVTEKLGIEYPIIQGCMQWIARAPLVAAVSEAGGLGIISSSTFRDKEALREEIRAVKAMTSKPFAVNLTLMPSLVVPDYMGYIQVCAEEGVRIIETAGRPPKDDMVAAIKGAGITLIHKCTTVKHALKAQSIGADMVVADGCECAGHPGENDITTMVLTPACVAALDIPVIAAGGIGDGRGIAAAFMLGAEAVQMGTRFVVAKESIVHENYKQRIIKAKDIDSAVTGRTHGHPVRCLRNQMTREYNRLEAEGKSFEELEYLTLGTLRKAVQEGDTTNGTVMAGQIAGLVTKEQTCKEMIDEMMEQADKLLGGCQK